MDGSFEFILGMYSIIIGLGVSKLLEGVKNVLLASHQLRRSGLYMGMLTIGLLVHATAWISLWSLRNVEVWQVWSFFMVMLTPVIMFLYSSVTVSDNDPSEDMVEYYFANARAMHGLLILAIVVNALTSLLMLGHAQNVAHVLTRLAVLPPLLLCVLMPHAIRMHRILVPAVVIGGLVPLLGARI